MKIYIHSLFLLLGVLLFSSCEERISPEGPIISETFSFSNFSSIEVNDGFEVFITQGTEEDVSIETNENIFEFISARQVGNRLIFETEGNVNFRGGVRVIIRITVISLQEMDASGGSEIRSTNIIETNNLGIRLSGGSEVTSDIRGANLNVQLSGGSELLLIGRSETYNLEASGGSSAEGFGLRVKDFSCQLSGGSDVSVSVTDNLYVSASGGSQVNYQGDGTVQAQNLSGGSTLRKR